MMSGEQKFAFGLSLLILLFIFLSSEADHWSVVEGSSEKATVVKSQFGVKPCHQDSSDDQTESVEWVSCIEVETKNGETSTFICNQEDPIAGLSAGDKCTICLKQRGITNNETAYFVNDVMVYYCTEEDLSKAFLKDFD